MTLSTSAMPRSKKAARPTRSAAKKPRQLFADVSAFYKKQQQLMDKANAVTPTNKKLRKKAVMKYSRARVETSSAIREIPFLGSRWKQFGKELERAADELAQLEAELKRLERQQRSGESRPAFAN